jgi:hypothetical protein
MLNAVSSSPGSSFSVSYDSTTKFISAVTCFILIGLTVTIRSVVGGCLSALIIALSYGYSPRRYIVSEGSVVVRRLIGSVRIPLDSIRDVRAASPEDLRGCIRLFGNGGLFGYYGRYRTSKLGTCHWYVTNRDNAVVLITSAKTSVFSPDDVNGFVATIQAVAPIPGALRAGQDSYSTRSSRSGGLRRNLIGVVIGILVILLLAAPLLYSPGPPGYTLSSEELTIHDRFYPVTVRAADVDVEHIGVVDIGADTHWRPTMRTNGFGGVHYHSGWFRVAGGEKVRMYRADSRRLVLIPPKGEAAPVLIEVKQPEAFIQEVRQAWR